MTTYDLRFSDVMPGYRRRYGNRETRIECKFEKQNGKTFLERRLKNTMSNCERRTLDDTFDYLLLTSPTEIFLLHGTVAREHSVRSSDCWKLKIPRSHEALILVEQIQNQSQGNVLLDTDNSLKNLLEKVADNIIDQLTPQ